MTAWILGFQCLKLNAWRINCKKYQKFYQFVRFNIQQIKTNVFWQREIQTEIMFIRVFSLHFVWIIQYFPIVIVNIYSYLYRVIEKLNIRFDQCIERFASIVNRKIHFYWFYPHKRFVFVCWIHLCLALGRLRTMTDYNLSAIDLMKYSKLNSLFCAYLVTENLLNSI